MKLKNYFRKRMLVLMGFVCIGQPIAANSMYRTQISDASGLWCRLSLAVGVSASAAYGIYKLFNKLDRYQYGKKMQNDPHNAAHYQRELNSCNASFKEETEGLLGSIKASVLIGSTSFLVYALTRPMK